MIYSATILYWLRDMSEDDADTLAFLDRRLAAWDGSTGCVSAQKALLERLPRPPRLRMPRGVGDTG